MKVKITNIKIDPVGNSRRVFFSREDGTASFADISASNPNKTWRHLSVGSYVKGLKQRQDGTISPDSDICVIPEGMENLPERVAKEITLKEPWFGAGTSLGWGLSDFWGFGVNQKIFDQADEIKIHTKYGDFEVTKEEVNEFAKTHRTSDKRGGTDLVVIPRAICRKI